MLKPETLKRIKRIELKTQKLVNDVFAGAYRSVFKGRGIAFESVRPYQPGDDVRDIDWNVTARTGEAYLKQYAEERELTVIIALDSSASNMFGTVNRQKRDLAAEIGAILALAASRNNDRVGLVTFSDQIEHITPPRKGRNHVLRIIRDVLTAQPTYSGTDIAAGLRAISNMQERRAIIFVLSDFLATGPEYMRQLRVTARHHDLIAVILSDPLEKRWPDAGLVTLADAETGENRTIDTSPARWREAFKERSKRFHKLRRNTLYQARVDSINLSVDEDYVPALIRFFEQRASRR